MTRLVIELDDAAAQRLAERAAREASWMRTRPDEFERIDLAGFTQEPLSERGWLNAVAGRNADDLLERERFGSTLIALHESIDSPETQPESTAGRLFRFFRLCRRVG